MATETISARWEQTYRAGSQLNLYPFDWVVKHFSQRFRDPAQRHSTRVLEIGCGAGNNVWFLARSGFRVSGIDASEAAIAFARERMAGEGLSADLQVADFTRLPYGDQLFDVVLDRGGITAAPFAAGKLAATEVARVLRPGGSFLFNPLSANFATTSPSKEADIGCLYDEAMVREVLIESRWKILAWRSLESRNHLLEHDVHAQWVIEAERV